MSGRCVKIYCKILIVFFILFMIYHFNFLNLNNTILGIDFILISLLVNIFYLLLIAFVFIYVFQSLIHNIKVRYKWFLKNPSFNKNQYWVILFLWCCNLVIYPCVLVLNENAHSMALINQFYLLDFHWVFFGKFYFSYIIFCAALIFYLALIWIFYSYLKNLHRFVKTNNKVAFHHLHKRICKIVALIIRIKLIILHILAILVARISKFRQLALIYQIRKTKLLNQFKKEHFPPLILRN
ncbi:hypothetical protein [Spiroplasma sp. DGKH1]|uniref:hypothetical protein n=1 Tax=Spiroplasma sp. DGKH1 TaxID=3050074 RepID=UPI0034C5E0BB